MHCKLKTVRRCATSKYPRWNSILRSHAPQSYMLTLDQCDLQYVNSVVLTCNNTRDTRDRDILIVSAVVTSPVAVLTVCYTCFSTTTSHVVQPNRSTTGAVAIVDKLSAVSTPCMATKLVTLFWTLMLAIIKQQKH